MKVDVERLVTTTNSGRPYLLYVGNRDIYKNFIPFLVAVSPILQQYDLGLICAGGGGFNEVEHKAIKSHGVESYVEQRSITDPILAQLYSHAVAFVFPSLYEGFGIPILESMACRCPCVLSDRSSLPEIAGEAALYFNPDNVDDMRAAITKILDDKAYREGLVDRGTKRASIFTWERTVQETLSFYTNIASKRV
jgi:glycosyltransferase involved in cell wall biosynthesis